MIQGWSCNIEFLPTQPNHSLRSFVNQSVNNFIKWQKSSLEHMYLTWLQSFILASDPYADMEEAWFDISITASHRLMFSLKFGVSSEDTSSLFCPSVLLFLAEYHCTFWKNEQAPKEVKTSLGGFACLFNSPWYEIKKGIWLYLSIHLGALPLIVSYYLISSFDFSEVSNWFKGNIISVYTLFALFMRYCTSVCQMSDKKFYWLDVDLHP